MSPNSPKKDLPGDESSARSDERPPRGGTPNFVPAGFWEKAGVWRLRERMSGSDYIRFIGENPPALMFCALWILASGFGQTFFLSIFQPFWLVEFKLSTGDMGLIYGGATLVSGLLLRHMGAWLDRSSASRVAVAAALGLALGSLILALSMHWIMLFVAIFTLRFFGQGVSSMLGMTSAVRRFPRAQSKAVTIAELGYPTGEALFPWLLAGGIVWLGWRGSAGLVAAALLLLILPLSMRLLSGADSETNEIENNDENANNSDLRETDKLKLFRDPRFLSMLLVITPLPFIVTGVIFFQTVISDAYGWPAHTFATGFLIFAVTRAACALMVGVWADKVGATRLFGMQSLLLGGGLLCLTQPQQFAAYGYFLAMGLAFGTSSAVVTPTLSRVFGIERIGQIQGATASVAVFSTALSPAVFGYAIELGLDTQTLVAVCAGYLLLVAWPVSLLIRRNLLRVG